jgi:hypothetical protein
VEALTCDTETRRRREPAVDGAGGAGLRSQGRGVPVDLWGRKSAPWMRLVGAKLLVMLVFLEGQRKQRIGKGDTGGGAWLGGGARAARLGFGWGPRGGGGGLNRSRRTSWRAGHA